MKISGVLLAAGSSSRMGSTNKLLLRYKNHTILEEVLTQLLRSKLEELFVVTGFECDQIEKILEPHVTEKIMILFNENHQQGRATSIHCAVNHIREKSQALFFMVADKPMVQSSLFNHAIDMFVKKQPDILYIQTPSGQGHPIIFSKKLFSELLELEGDITGNSLIERHRARTVVIEDNTTQQDINTYEDYLSLINKKM